MRDHTRDLLKMSRPNSFSYDRDGGVFKVGEKGFDPLVLPTNFGALALAQDEELSDGELDSILKKSAVVYSFRQPIMLPGLYDWLEGNLTPSLIDETTDVIREVFVQLRPDLSHAQKDPGGFIGYNVGRTTNEHPHLIFQTLGNCACMSVSQHGVFGESKWDDKIATFSDHNVDSREQKISLLAGLGHIAHRSMSY